MITRTQYQRGSVGVIVTIVLLALLTLGSAGLAIWAYINYDDQRTNVQAKVDQAVAVAEKIQADDLEKKFQEREKEPNRAFAGPADLGTLGFKYPKTWSVHVANNGSAGDDFEAYLNPGVVPPISDEARYALRVNIKAETYEQVIEEYQALVEEGALRTSATKANGQNGTRLDGKFTEDIRGAAVVYKIRDKTVIIRTDADTFKPDFERIIKTITFVQ